MTWGMIGAGAISVVGGYLGGKSKKKAAEKAAKAQTLKEENYRKYLEAQANAPKKMQHWNPVEYAQKKEMIEQDNLRRASLGAGMIGGMEHYGAGKTSKSKTGVTRYDRAGGSIMDSMKSAGFLDALKAQQNRKLDPGMLDIDKRYLTEGIKPGESPDWAVGVKQPPPPAAPPAGVAPPAGAVPPAGPAGATNPLNARFAAYMANRAKLTGQG